jgi:DNA end-binding protein Ku
MPRAMWRGAIQFGLVTVPVKLYLATEARGGLSFHLLHKPDMERIQMKIHCPVHGEIPRSETVRGYEYAKGQYIVIEESDFDAVPLKTVRAIEIEQFVEASRDSATTFVKQAYYLEPDPVARKAFYLLKEVLADEGLSAICKIVLKDREALAALNPFSNTMLLSTLYWPDEIRSTAELDLPDEDFKFKPSEKAMAKQLVAAMRGEFDPANYEDEYRKALTAVIEAKVDGQPVVARAAAEKPTKIADLMSVLEASVAAAREAKAGRGAAGTAAKPAARKAAAKPAAKRTAKAVAAKAESAAKPKAKRKAA